MSALGVQSQINKDRALWLSSIPTDVIHGNVICDTLFANAGYISTLYSDNINVSTLNASSLSLTTSDVSGMYVSSLRGNTAFFSSMTLASDLSGGVGFVRFSVDASGIQVDGDPIRFDNLVYLTSTINIIQVSTLVDTDIFAQNGYFSTLSSGSFSSGLAHISSLRVEDLSANNGTFNTLFVSTLEALDISGVAASNWSQYPTLASSIIFQPAYILSNVSNKLYFAGQELTDLSGGGVDWSYFDAQTDVSMNNFSLRGLSTLQYQDGARLYSQTGNNLFYNGQPVQYGAASNVSQWANYPAVANVNMRQSTLSNALLLSSSNLALSGSNITNGNTFTNSLGVGGTSLVSLATITSGGDLTCRNIDVGDSTTSLADVNIYGATAAPGDSALYVEGGVQFSGGTIHGFSAGVLPVAGVNTGRIDMLQAGFNLLHPLTGAITTGAALGITAGGAISMAAGGYLEMNTSTLQMINTSQGNKNTTIQAGFLTVDPDLAPTSSIKLFNTLGGGVEIDGGGQGSLQGFSTVNAQFISSLSTNANTSRVNFAFVSTMFANFILCQSSVFNNIAVNNIKIADDITGVTNAPMPLESRIVNFSSINSFNVSTTDLWVSSINGQVIDPSGSSLTTISSFNTAQTSTLRVSTLAGWTGNTLFGSTINVETGFTFVGQGTAGPTTGKFLSSLRNIFTDTLNIELSNANWTYNANSPGDYIRIGGGSAFDSYFRENSGRPAFSTNQLMTSSIVTTTLDISGGLTLSQPLLVPLGNSVQFDDGSLVNYSQFQYRDVAQNAMVALVNTFGEAPILGSNMMPLGVGELWVTGATDTYGAARLYSVPEYANFGIDIIDADGATLLEAMNVYDVGGNVYQQNLYVVSSITGYIPPGGGPAHTGFTDIVTVPTLSTQNLLVSSINGSAYSPGGGTNQYQELFTSSFQFSTATSYGSNTNFNFPLVIDYDHAGAGTAASGVGIIIQGHNFGTGAVINQLQMGARADGANYIMSSWPGHNLEDLYIDATDVTFNDGSFSTIVNSDPYGLITNGSISAPSLLVSSINGNDARPAYTNNLTLSTMELYAASTTLMYWDSVSPSSNINSSGYDVVVGVDGTYKIGASYQFISGGTSDEVEFFLLKNDSVISRSGGIVEVANNQEIVQYAEILETCLNGDKIQAGCYTANSGVFVSTINGNVIQSPAVILTMYKVD